MESNFVAKIWKSSNLAWHDMPDIIDNGWLENGEIHWVENVFPDDIEDILVDPEFYMNYNDSDGDNISDEECESYKEPYNPSSDIFI